MPVFRPTAPLYKLKGKGTNSSTKLISKANTRYLTLAFVFMKGSKKHRENNPPQNTLILTGCI